MTTPRNSWQTAAELDDCWNLVEEYEAEQDAEDESNNDSEGEAILAHAYTVIPHRPE